MFHALYETVNLVNGKYYRGIHSTHDVNDSYLGSGSILKRAIKKYGPENFIRYFAGSCRSREELIAAERELVDQACVDDSRCYNRSLGGNGGCIPTDETRAKMSAALRGKKRSPEHCARIAAAKTGKKRSIETRAKMSAANIGKKLSPEHRAKMSAARTGKKQLSAHVARRATAKSLTWLIVFPDGRSEQITNLCRFCREHRLCQATMCMVANGKRTHHKRFKCERI